MVKNYQNRYSSPRFLIIEDEFMIADLMDDIICSLGYTVAGTASTPSSARQQLYERSFDAALLDLGLDGQHGPEIADQLLEMKVPFAFVTGYDGPFEKRHAAVPLLRKPFTLNEFAKLLETLAGRPEGQESPGETSPSVNASLHSGSESFEHHWG
jgi:CheY-like chemotaxis protein